MLKWEEQCTFGIAGNVSIINSTFENNHASTNIHIHRDCWTNNTLADKVLRIGGAIATFESRLIISGCSFINNTSDFNGGS